MESNNVQIIELHMMDSNKYVPLVMASNVGIRIGTYPLILVRTRLQVQKHRDMYKGMFDAFSKIAKSEGVFGLYKGFLGHNFQFISSMVYIFTYEHSRRFYSTQCGVNNALTISFLAGATASVMAQPVTIPIDNVIQRQQMYVSDTHSQSGQVKKRISFTHVCRQILSERGIRGFYRGAGPSVFSYALSSSCYWTAYTKFADLLGSVIPTQVPHMVMLPMAAMCASITVTITTNPIDLVRTRVQVNKERTWPCMMRLFKEEGMSGLFLKGASARLVYSSIFSFFIMFFYEGIKRVSLLDEYKEDLRW